MTEKQLFRIMCYIPSDENIVVANIFKLVELGYKEKKFGFICLTRSGGFGTGTDNFGCPSEAEAIVSMLKVEGMFNNETSFDKLDYMTFEDAVSYMNEFKTILENKLEEDGKI